MDENSDNGFPVVFECCGTAEIMSTDRLFGKATCPLCLKVASSRAISLVPLFCFIPEECVFELPIGSSGDDSIWTIARAISATSTGNESHAEEIRNCATAQYKAGNTLLSKGVSMIAFRTNCVDRFVGGVAYTPHGSRYNESRSGESFQVLIMLLAPHRFYGDLLRSAMAISYAARCFFPS